MLVGSEVDGGGHRSRLWVAAWRFGIGTMQKKLRSGSLGRLVACVTMASIALPTGTTSFASIAATTLAFSTTSLTKHHRSSRLVGVFPKKNTVVKNHVSPLTMTGGAIEDNDSTNGDDDVLRGRSLLCLVALLYGTLNVSLRLVYQLPAPPTAAALSATRGILASLCFVLQRSKDLLPTPIRDSIRLARHELSYVPKQISRQPCLHKNLKLSESLQVCLAS